MIFTVMGDGAVWWMWLARIGLTGLTISLFAVIACLFVSIVRGRVPRSLLLATGLLFALSTLALVAVAVVFGSANETVK